MTNNPAAELARRVAERVPGATAVHYSSYSYAISESQRVSLCFRVKKRDGRLVAGITGCGPLDMDTMQARDLAALLTAYAAVREEWDAEQKGEPTP